MSALKPLCHKTPEEVPAGEESENFGEEPAEEQPAEEPSEEEQ